MTFIPFRYLSAGDRMLVEIVVQDLQRFGTGYNIDVEEWTWAVNLENNLLSQKVTLGERIGVASGPLRE